MYTNFSLKSGIPIGTIKGGKFDGHTIKLNKSDSKVNQEFLIDDEGKVAPHYTKQLDGKFPNRVAIAGASLCGKSHLAREIAKDYIKNNPGNRIVLFSAIDNKTDGIFNEIEDDIYRIRCDESILDDPIDLPELHDSLVIFDDIDRFPSKELCEELNLLRDKIFNSGRHDNIDVISIGQILLDGKKTKTANTNAFQLASFPQSGSRYQLAEFLRRYMSLPKDMIQKILSIPSRWVIINICNPNYVLHEKGSFVI